MDVTAANTQGRKGLGCLSAAPIEYRVFTLSFFAMPITS
ncbi:Uncharacterised protein [uncultured archaeon]|nr:Uncharacterised protein [uncultured archaeon]